MSSKPRNLVLVSGNRLLAEATGEALVREGAADSYLHMKRDLNSQQLRTVSVPMIIVLNERQQAEEDDLFSLIRRLAQELPGAHIVVVGDGDSHCVAGCIASGASSFVLNCDTLGELAATIRALQEGSSRCSARVLDVVLGRIRELSATQHNGVGEQDDVLTQREIEVLQLVEQGLLNKEIAGRLGIAVSTVKNHLHAIFEKFQVSERRQAVRHGIAIGLLPCRRNDAVA